MEKRRKGNLEVSLPQTPEAVRTAVVHLMSEVDAVLRDDACV